MYKKTHVFLFFISSIFEFYFLNALVFVDIDQYFIRKNSKILEMKNKKKTTWVFLISISLKQSVGHKPIFFLKSDLYSLTKDLTYYIQCLLFFQGAYKGPIMNSEHLAGILAILVFYCAYTSKANLLA